MVAQKAAIDGMVLVERQRGVLVLRRLLEAAASVGEVALIEKYHCMVVDRGAQIAQIVGAIAKLRREFLLNGDGFTIDRVRLVVLFHLADLEAEAGVCAGGVVRVDRALRATGRRRLPNGAG